MSLTSYLPSSQFSAIAGSVILAGALIVGAQYVSVPQKQTSLIESAPAAPENADWRSALEAVQAEAPSLPPAPSADMTQTLLTAAKTSNYTDTVARSLLVNLSSASSQGLGADTPTQDSIISSAVAQLPATQGKIYKNSDLSLVADSKDAQHAYGNAVMVALGHHASATTQATFYALDQAIEQNDPTAATTLTNLQNDYAALAQELSKVPVPKTLAPLHWQAINSISTVAASFENLVSANKDPLRALQGLQQYNQNIGKVANLFTSLAISLNKNGILFTKDEPGAAWSVFVAPDTP